MSGAARHEPGGAEHISAADGDEHAGDSQYTCGYGAGQCAGPPSEGPISAEAATKS